MIGQLNAAIEKTADQNIRPQLWTIREALENDMKLYSIPVEGNSFSIDVQDDLLKARVAIKSDKFFGQY